MKKNFVLILTALFLLAIALFLAFLLQGREQLISDENVTVIPKETDTFSPADGITEAAIETGEVVSVEEEILFPSFGVYLKYENYPMTYTYFLAEQTAVNIYSEPSDSGNIIKKVYQNEKLNYIETVHIKTSDAENERWYHVTWEEDGDRLFGFVRSDSITKRCFQFDKMEEALLKLQEYADRSRLTYINNYKNIKGNAPLYHGKTVDAAGNSRSQSAPGYPSLSNMQEFSYIGDGTLVRYLYSGGDYIKVQVIASGKTYFIPKKYIPAEQALDELRKAIIIDRKYQNEAVYEKIDDTWNLISYTLATTGTKGEYAQPTPLGYYYGIEKKTQFLYYKDGTTEIQGYAPYAIRFAGGAYVHGVPVDFKYDENGERITPPEREYSITIGTYPLSHKCVRNYTSHAKFLYDWFSQDETVIIVIE